MNNKTLYSIIVFVVVSCIGFTLCDIICFHRWPFRGKNNNCGGEIFLCKCLFGFLFLIVFSTVQTAEMCQRSNKL